MSTEEQQRVRGRGWAVTLLVVGAVLVVAGIAFHGVAAAHRPSGPGGSTTWEALLDHAALRWGAYGAVVGGVYLVVRGWNLRRRP
ncbi:ATP/ADP translocase [Kineococcus radiotolerans]|uniref:ATP/ADP translocase n=1 Tax=Kineococcus radiotolerans TaxID=131568 RepID=A0A7W4TL58_KINRA|nr:hypothetical protein [Kineococcus radiotolerans]MBB2900865.1 ATP/ADP translocase [Kineococcus radiotolerans]